MITENKPVSDKFKAHLEPLLKTLEDSQVRDLVFRYCQVLQSGVCDQVADVELLMPLMALLGLEKKEFVIQIQISVLKFVVQTAESMLSRIKDEGRFK